MAVITSSATRDWCNTPSPEFIAELRRRYPTEREVDRMLTRKMERRGGPGFTPIALWEMSDALAQLLSDQVQGDFRISDERWLTGGASKIQMGCRVRWQDPDGSVREDRMVVRMDPAESLNATSRVVEFEVLRALEGVIPVPKTYWVDPDGRWFPEPALVYAFADGVTKPTATTTGKVSGVGTNFGPELRAQLAPQFVDYLARIHTFDHQNSDLRAIDRPADGSTESAQWQLNRARRVWEEDRGEDVPLMEVAANWLQRNLPSTDQVSVVHGDYRSGNFLFNEHEGRITAWLDWERAHLGDRHRDLAWMTNSLFGHYDEDGKTYLVCGLVPIESFYEQYEKASGLTVDPARIEYYKVLNCYQLIVGILGSAYRVVKLGKSHQDILLARIEGTVSIIAKELRERLEAVA